MQPPLVLGVFKNEARRETREDRCSCERSCSKKRKFQQRPKESHKTKRTHLIRDNRDSGDLMRNFSSVHIGNSRLTTMQGSNGLGIFKNGRASSSTRRRGSM
ncbi:Bgt-1814 [Blumeria graminis f. sp. tritici]|uniref:Bgt-1814 n=2 Tax=Blumeria graminis f. sp. tritici TaxID=62690 RepID=A0A061HD19_BLUGR|nr:hypothetical protein BGT96224_1814 [Blumeria graminis f. sp. tritici 96224]VDB90737.1 Bgt-1814 [Blumeria graminis f. sp. tritici]